ncbi:hypothetical protein HU200_059260 [Digitaria exilis]|uniref:FBD domain-containing protein n=1 Tax=Digitaria exilis TaxID=1010633 RepID=A0A835ABM2_9POAL|nr:hypothetical protein HU200_059260 [Digitaria exilis]
MSEGLCRLPFACGCPLLQATTQRLPSAAGDDPAEEKQGPCGGWEGEAGPLQLRRIPWPLTDNLERLFVQLPDITHWSLEDQGERDGPPEHGLRNLRMVKVMKFNWRRFEVQLVSSLLSMASSLDKLLLVSPNVSQPHVRGVQEADLSPLEEALASGRITILTKSNDRLTRPFHL